MSLLLFRLCAKPSFKVSAPKRQILYKYLTDIGASGSRHSEISKHHVVTLEDDLSTSVNPNFILWSATMEFLAVGAKEATV